MTKRQAVDLIQRCRRRDDTEGRRASSRFGSNSGGTGALNLEATTIRSSTLTLTHHLMVALEAKSLVFH